MNPPRTIKAGRLSVEYLEVGEGPADVVLLHGNFATWRWWAPSLAQLPAGVRALAPTMRGCAGTQGTGSGFDIASLARDVEAFASAKGLQRFHLVGHSLGGAIALQYALDRPGRVTGLDLISPAPGDALESMLAQDTAAGRMLRTLNPERVFDRAALLTMLRLGRDLGTNRRYLRRMLLNLMPGVDEEAVNFARLLSDAAEMEPSVIVNLYRALARWDVRARRAELRVPTRVLAGAKDVLVPLPALETLVAGLPSATLEVRPQGGHSPMLEHPLDFGLWLAAGIQAAPAPSSSVLELPGKVAAWLAGPVRPEPQVEVLPPEAPRPGLWARLRLAWDRLRSWLFGPPPPPLPAGPSANGSQPPGK